MRIRRALLAPYHYAWGRLAPLYYGRPARKLTVIGVTGTKGKSTVVDLLYTIFTHAGHTTALAGTIRFAIGADSQPNLYKMTLPGRGFIQKFLSRAVHQGATHAIIEVTSEAAVQYRHLGLELDGLVFLNLQKEHLESHGSMEKYFQAKYMIGTALARSTKRPRAIIANADDPYGLRFLALPVEHQIPFSYQEAEQVELAPQGVSFRYKNVAFTLSLPGATSVMNALAAIKAAEAFGVPLDTTAEALAQVVCVSGRFEHVDAGQPFSAIVDYAHTPDSLQALYDAFPQHRKICVLGNTGGGRDTWKRPEMGRVADESCALVILTNEDPYDEDPQRIVEAMAAGMKRKPTIIMDRRKAIRHALAQAQPGDVVLVSGKGTDPYIMGPRGTKTPWSDARIVREELEELVAKTGLRAV